MADWNMVRLEELSANEKSAISKPYGSAILKEDYQSDGVPVVRGVNLARGIFHDDDFVFIGDELANRMPGAEMKAGDLVVTHRGTVGQVSMIPRKSSHKRYVASTSQVKVRLDSDKAIPEFYYYWFSSPVGKRSILENASTVGVPGIAQPVATVKRLQVPFPPLSVQRAIVEVLGALDDKIAANHRVVDLSDKLAEAILSAALDGRASPLVSQAHVTMGSSPPGTSYNEREDGLPFYQGVRDFGIRFPRRRVWTTAPVRMARTGDTLVSVRAPVGRTNIANEDMCIGRGVASLRTRAECPMTLFHQVRIARDAWAPFEAEGTVFGAINKGQLEGVLLPMVRPGASDNVEQALKTLENRIAAALSENETLVTTRDQLLPLLMSGKVRVREAEKVVEGVV